MLWEIGICSAINPLGFAWGNTIQLCLLFCFLIMLMAENSGTHNTKDPKILHNQCVRTLKCQPPPFEMEDQTPVSPTNWQIIPHIGLDIIWTSMVIPFSEGISLYNSTIFQLRHHQFFHFQETSHLLAAVHSLLQHPMRSLVLPPVRSEPPCRRSMFLLKCDGFSCGEWWQDIKTWSLP